MVDNLVPTDLRVDYLVDPLGLDNPTPSFSWRVESSGRGGLQRGYQVLVASSEALLDQDVGDLWDSGFVQAGNSVSVVYQGKPLESYAEYFWKVRVWDEQDQVSPYSAPARFEMGILDEREWHGEWIGVPHERRPRVSALFRREFLLEKPIRRARAYVTGLGYYELWLNGQKVGRNVLDPGWTDTDKRVLYSTYDIAPYLRVGENAIGILVGLGWAAQQQTLCQLRIEYGDGTITELVTKGSDNWWASLDGPIRYNHLFNGEHYDARLEQTGWAEPGFVPSHGVWREAVTLEPPKGKLVSQLLEPIQAVDELIPQSIREPKPGVYVFDLGQNIAGWARLKVQGPRGSRVALKFAEILHEDGTVNQANLRSAQATDIYFLKGDGVEVYEPRFTYHGFRYIQVEGFPGTPTKEAITGIVVRSAVKPRGQFNCSNDLLNRIHKAIWWTEACNLHSIPTDCPQRDERCGWLNDLTARAEESILNFHMYQFYRKWLDDIADTQGEKTGAIADTAPYQRMYGGYPADPVSSCYLIIPWLLYLHYGNRELLEKHYAGMCRWAEYLHSQAKDYILHYSYYGDWASPIAHSIPESIGAGAVSAITPGSLMSTGYYYYNYVLLSKIAKVLGKDDDARRFAKRAEGIRAAFNAQFFDAATGQYAGGSQGSNTLALFLDLVPPEHRSRVVENLVRDIEAHDWHITTGNQCTKYIFEVLAAEGRADVAYKLLTQTTYPSWGYMLSMGATTIWERWEYETGARMNSHCHPMYGAVGAWFYTFLAGIRPSEEGVGFGQFEIQPLFIDELDYVHCSLETVRGPITVHWTRKEQGIQLKVEIPWNSVGYIKLPDLSSLAVAEGDRLLLEDGHVQNLPPGVRAVRQRDGLVVIEAGAGSYGFWCTW